MLCHIAAAKALCIFDYRADILFSALGSLSYSFNRFENRVLIKPVLEGFAKCHTFHY